MPVTIESAGSHAFDLNHLRRQGGEELVELFLHNAGINTELPWRLQVQKKLLCNSETPPVRVVDEPKKWAVYLKIKPGDNNSCHYCSLLMPDGLQGQQIYSALKQAEEALDRNWRHKPVERLDLVPSPPPPPAPIYLPFNEMTNGTPAPPPETPQDQQQPETCAEDPATVVPPEESPAMPPPTDLVKSKGAVRGWAGDPEKRALLLDVIREINEEGAHNHDHFVQKLIEKVGWEAPNRYEVGGVFTSLVRNGYIMRKLRGTRPCGYELTESGWQIVADKVGRRVPGSHPAAPAPAPAPAFDLFQVIRSFGPIAKRFLEANDRLEEIMTRETQLTTELEALRKERTEICQFLDDEETQRVLASLSQLRRSNETGSAGSVPT